MVWNLGFPCIVDRDDVGVVELGGSLGFSQQARAAIGAQPGGGQHLHRDVTVQHGVVGAIDPAHAAPAQLCVEAIPFVEQGTEYVHTPNPFTAKIAMSSVWVASLDGPQ
jgi:hypothetical protein